MRDARNHYPQIKHHTPPPKQGNNNQPRNVSEAPPPLRAADLSPVSHTGRRDSGPVVSKPNSVSDEISAPAFPRQRHVCCAPDPHPLQVKAIYTIRSRSRRSAQCGPASSLVVLLRKEVIQPHLPVRLPCYDFVPIADPTFDGSLPQGVRPPASGVTDFHDVTGGVYKARERIHRSVADLRLLATPTSRGRVADPDPN